MRSAGRGLTELEILILIAIVAAGVALGLLWESARDREPPSGVLPLSVETAERTLVVAGETYGYWARDGTAGGIRVSFPPDAGPEIDAILVPVQLLVGQDPLDMGTVRVAVRYRASTAVLDRKDDRPLGRSSWTVAGKAGVLPLQDADRDDLLEGPETFLVLVLPPGPLEPGGHVTVTLSPAPGIPLVIDRDIPGRVTPVTLLSF